MKVLLSSRKAKLAQRIEKLGMSVADFAYSEDERARSWEFHYYKGPYRFVCNQDRITFCPAQFAFEEDIRSYFCRFWLVAKASFYRWLEYVHREISSADPWKQLSDQALVVDDVPSAGPQNTPFTSRELPQIESTVNSIRNYIFSQNIASPRREAIDLQLSELIESSTRFGRKDWVALALGQILSLCVTAAFAPEQTKHVFMLLKAGLESLLHLEGLVPLPR